MLAIRVVRVGRNMTLDDLSRVTAIAGSRLSLIEREKVDPTREEILRIAGALSWPPDEIEDLVRPLVDRRLSALGETGSR